MEDQYPRWAHHMEGPPGRLGLPGPRTAGVTPAGEVKLNLKKKDKSFPSLQQVDTYNLAGRAKI